MSATYDRILTDIQADLAGRLLADQVLGRLVIVTERTADILAEVQRALGLAASKMGSRGLCLVVLQATANPDSQEVQGPLLELRLGVRVLENPVLNRTGLDALTVCRRILRILHHYHPVGLTSLLLADTPAIQPVADPIAPLAYDVGFTTREGQFTIAAKVAAPAISATAATVPSVVTLTCATAGAGIWYTLDGTHPHRGNSQAVEYSEPFTVTVAARVRAAGHLTDHIASDVQALDID